jgi:hypothetical protein
MKITNVKSSKLLKRRNIIRTQVYSWFYIVGGQIPYYTLEENDYEHDIVGEQVSEIIPAYTEKELRYAPIPFPITYINK